MTTTDACSYVWAVPGTSINLPCVLSAEHDHGHRVNLPKDRLDDWLAELEEVAHDNE